MSFIFSTYDEVYTSDVKSFLTQECNQVVDRLENRKLAAAKPLNLKVLLTCNTDTTWPRQDKVPLEQKRDFSKANQVTRGNNPSACVLCDLNLSILGLLLDMTAEQ